MGDHRQDKENNGTKFNIEKVMKITRAASAMLSAAGRAQVGLYPKTWKSSSSTTLNVIEEILCPVILLVILLGEVTGSADNIQWH